MSRMPTLFSRLSLVFTVILLCLGMMILFIFHRSQQRYFEEFNQQLNRPVARYIADQNRLFIDGMPDTQTLKELARHVMMINPTLEVYLLDQSGHILASAIDASSVLVDHVSLAPIHRFLTEGIHLPVYGDDPKVPDRKQVFSAYPVGESPAGNTGCSPCGYVYAVLGGERYRSLWQSLFSSYTLRIAAVMLGGVFLFSMFAGVSVFFLMTRPLRKLTNSLADWRLPIEKGDLRMNGWKPGAPEHCNELLLLERTCHAMAERLGQQLVELDKTDRQRRSFLTSVSHDLRTPLTSLCGAVETMILKKGQMCEADETHYLMLAHRQGRRMRCLIDQLFELARLDSGDVTLSCESFSLPELVFDTVQDFDSMAAARHVRLVVSRADPSNDFIVYSDIRLVQRVLENLLTNAVRHTRSAGSVTVRLSAPEIRSVRVEITDTGTGFHCRFSGESLSAVEDQIIEKACGSGLGLGIVQRILALHGSQARVWSEPGRGTRVCFELAAVATD